MRWIQTPKGSQELTAFQLQIVRQARRLQECFLKFDLGFVIVVQQENDIRESFEVRIDCAVKREFGVASVEATLLRIMIAYFNVIEIGGAGIRQRKHTVQ